jgi:PKD repeat protein
MKRTRGLFFVSCLGVLLAGPGIGWAQGTPPCPFLVDVAGTVGVGGVTHTSIQAAVNDLPNPGPCLVRVRPGTYVESVQITETNTLATSESERIVIVADAPADAKAPDTAKVVVTPPQGGGSASTFVFGIERSKFITLKSFDIRGAREGVVLYGLGGSNGNEDIILDSNDIHHNGAGSHLGAVAIGQNSTRTWLVNNLIRDNAGNGVLVEGSGAPPDDTVYIVNNTVFRNAFNGLRVSRKRFVYLVNNLIVGNGTANLPGRGQTDSSGVDAGRWGLFREGQGGQGVIERTTLLRNYFYRNGDGKPAGHGGDIANVAQLFEDGSSNGNYTTFGNEAGAPAIVGCTFSDCTGASDFSALFIDPAKDFRLTQGSPAIDRGLDTLVHNGLELVPGMDFEGEARPQDGSTDVGYDEVAAALPTFRAIADCAPPSGVAPLRVRYRGRGEFRGGSIVLYRWDFQNDGTFDTFDAVPQDYFRTLAQPGVYVARLQVTNNLGDTATDTCTVNVAAGPPLATADAAPSNGPVPLTVTFTGAGFKEGGEVVLHEWDLNGDGTFETRITDFVSPRPDTLTFHINHYSCGTNNRFDFYLNNVLIHSATAPIGCTCNSQEPAFTISDPNAFTGWNTAGGNILKVVAGSSIRVGYIRAVRTPGESVCLFDRQPDGRCAVRNACDNNQIGGTYSGPAETGVKRSVVQHTYTAQGTFNARFRVTDNEGKTAMASQASTSVRVGAPGSPVVRAAATPTSGSAPLAVSFSGSATDDGSIVRWEWDFDGNGTFDYSSATSAATTFTYRASGSFVAALRATDNAGLSSIDLVEVKVGLVASLAIPDDTFDPARGETTAINTSISAAAPVRLLITNREGTVVRTLVHQTRAAGSYSDPWDGRDDAGQVLSQAPYYVILEYEAAGETKRLDMTNTTGGVRYNPGRNSLPSTFRPFEDNLLTINFTIPANRGASEVLAFIGLFNVDTRFITLVENVPLGVGTHTIHWDGRAADGKAAVPPPGDAFLFGIFAFTLPDNAIMIQSAPVVSGVNVEPNYYDPATPNFLTEDRPAAVVTYSLDKAANVELTVTNLSNGRVVRTILVPNVPAGTGRTIQWDGRVESATGLFADKGDYRLTLRAIDSAGNVSINRFALVRIFY